MAKQVLPYTFSVGRMAFLKKYEQCLNVYVFVQLHDKLQGRIGHSKRTNTGGQYMVLELHKLCVEPPMQ